MQDFRFPSTINAYYGRVTVQPGVTFDFFFTLNNLRRIF
jgi:hypothetical protein